MTSTEFEPKTYWEKRLRSRFDLTGVGFRRRSASYNSWLYRIRTETLEDIFSKHGWPTKKNAVIDVGCGTGYFIDYWLRKDADPVVGVDFTEVTIEKLKTRYPEATFYCADISDPKLNLNGVYDYISIFDVLYHIVEDEKFYQAVKNFSKICKPGTKIFTTDLLGPKTVSVVKHCNNRSLELYKKVFLEQGFKLLEIRPLYFTLVPPTGLRNSFLRWVGLISWELVTGVARLEFFGKLLGRVLYKLDSVLRKILARSPSGQLAVFEFVGDYRLDEGRKSVA